ncbi:MAG: STAS domain-containing protein [Burkholderiaceae bacterium]
MLLLPATLTAREARDTLSMLSQAMRNEPAAGVTVDASGLAQLDSAALAVLLECRRLALSWGKAYAVRDAPATLLSLARLYGVDELLFGSAEPPPP